MSADAFRETLAFLAQTPQRIASLIGDLNNEAARLRPTADDWCAVEQLCHLRDIEEEGYLSRARRIIAEDNPELFDLDGGKLAQDRDYRLQDFASALRAFATARGATIQILRNATPVELVRRGHFAGSAEITLAGLANMMRAHDDEHLLQIETLCNQLTAKS